MNQLHPGARWIFRFRAYFSLIFLLIFFFIFGLGILASFSPESFFSGLFFSFLIILILIILIGEIYARMAYNRWFYEFTPTNLKIERGIIWKRYSNVPYERVQNVDITRGILARLLGYSTLNIQTAGYSGVYARGGFGAYGVGSEGHIPAISMDKAEKIRDFLMKKIGKKSGL